MKNPKLQKLFERRFKVAKEYRKPFEAKWKILTDLYHLTDPTHPKWDFISFLKDYADSIGVRWEAGLFAGRQFFGLKGNPSKYDDNADKMANIITYQAEEENGLLSLLRNSIIPLSYLGNVILKGGWQSNPNAPSWSDIPLMDFWCRPKSSGIDKTLGWCIYRSKYTLKELRELEENGVLQDIDNIVNFVSPQSKDSADKQGDDLTLEARGVKLSNIEPSAGDDKEDPDKEYTIFHMWEENRYVSFEETSMEIISVPDMAEKPQGLINTVLNAVGISESMDGWTSNDCVDDKGKPYFPFVLLRPIPEKGVFYGLSPVEAHIILQYNFNENRYQKKITLDVIKKGIWLGRRGCGIDWSRLEKEAIIMAETITENDIRRLDVGGAELISVFERDETSFIQMGDRSSGVYDPQRGGGEGDVTKTVGGLTLLLKEGNLKFARHITNIHTDGLRPLIMINVYLNQQFLEEAKEIRIANKPTEVQPDEVVGKFRYEMISAPGLGQQDAQQQMYGGLVAFYKDDIAIKIDELKKKHLKSSDCEPADFMWTTEEQDIIAENMQLKQMVMQLQQTVATAQPVTGGTETPPVTQPTQPVKQKVMI